MYERLRQRALCGFCMALAWAPAQAQQSGGDAARSYLRAVAEHYHVSIDEIRILREWNITAQEVPVVLFIARRAGVSPDALAALHGPGTSWMELASRYNIDSADLYVRLADGAEGTRLERAYQAFAARSRREWSAVRLRDAEVVALVNLRFISSVVGESPDLVLNVIREEEGFIPAFRTLSGA